MSEHDEQIEPTKKAPTTTSTLNLAGSPKAQSKINYNLATNRAEGSSALGANNDIQDGIRASVLVISTIIRDASVYIKKEGAAGKPMGTMIDDLSDQWVGELQRIAAFVDKARAPKDDFDIEYAMGELAGARVVFIDACLYARASSHQGRVLTAIDDVIAKSGRSVDRVMATNDSLDVGRDQAFTVNINAAISHARAVQLVMHDDKAASAVYMNARDSAEEARIQLEQLAKPRKKYAGYVEALRKATEVAEKARNHPKLLDTVTRALQALVV